MNDVRAKDRQALLVLTLCAGVLGVVFSIAAVIEQAAPRVDPITLHVDGQPSRASVCLLIDVTDRLTGPQERRLEDWAHEFELHQLRVNDLVSVWELGATEDGSLDRLYCHYFPGREANALWANPAHVAAQCESLFWSPLVSVLRSVPAHAGANSSPILSAIQELSEQDEFAGRVAARRLVVVSDLFENSAATSFYRQRPDFNAVRALPTFATLRANLQGASVQVLYITRPGDSQIVGVHVREFWREYFHLCGAGSVAFQRL